MLKEGRNAPFTMEPHIDNLKTTELSSETITLHVRLSDKIDVPMAIRVSRIILDGIVERLKKKDIKPEITIEDSTMLSIATSDKDAVQKEVFEESRIKQPKKRIPLSLTSEQKEEFSKIHQRSRAKIASFIRHKLQGVPQDIEDLTQITFENALRDFPPKYIFPNLQNPYLPWLYKIAGNAIKNKYREYSRKSKRTVELVDEGPLSGEGTPDIALGFEVKEQRIELQRAISLLQDPYPLIVWLKSLHWSNIEIASLLNSTEGSIKSMYHRATIKLKEIFSKRDGLKLLNK